jgi:hypothetical protein
MSTFQAPLSNAQIELLNLFSQPLPDESMADLKHLLLQFKFDQLDKLASEEWGTKNMSQATITERLQGHQRTPYASQNRFLKKA